MRLEKTGGKLFFFENWEPHAKVGKDFLSGLMNQESERESESNAIFLMME